MGVEGWLTEREGRLLFDRASRCTGRGVIVEIGSWKGKSTTSKDAAKDFDRPVALIYLDGVHLYDYLGMDFEL